MKNADGKPPRSPGPQPRSQGEIILCIPAAPPIIGETLSRESRRGLDSVRRGAVEPSRDSVENLWAVRAGLPSQANKKARVVNAGW